MGASMKEKKLPPTSFELSTQRQRPLAWNLKDSTRIIGTISLEQCAPGVLSLLVNDGRREQLQLALQPTPTQYLLHKAVYDVDLFEVGTPPYISVRMYIDEIIQDNDRVGVRGTISYRVWGA